MMNVVPAACLLLIASCVAAQAELKFTHHFIDRALPGDSWGQTALADLDRDGKLDFVTGKSHGDILWFRYRTRENWERHPLGTDSPSDVGGAVLDLDGDGWPDFVAGGAWYQNSRQPLQKPFQRHLFDPELTAVHDVVAADLDSDGKLDIITMSDRNNLRWYSIPSDPTQRWTRHDIGPDVHAGIAVGDLDQDGDLDVVRSNLWFQNADGKASKWYQHLIPFGKPTGPYPLATRCAVLDLDRDGDNDLVLTENEIRAGKIAWLENRDSKGRAWHVHPLPTTDSTPRGAYHNLAVADFDRDGDPDIFSCEMEGIPGDKPPRWFVWENLDAKAGQFAERVILDANLGGHEAVVGDVDGDGDLDICSKLWRPRPDNANHGMNHADFLENVSTPPATNATPQADLILLGGKVVTVDPNFTITQALAVQGNKILGTGSNAGIEKWRGPNTRVIHLRGRTVLPGLIDSHVHPGAAMTEFDHPIPDMESIDDVLTYIRKRTQTVPEGDWIQLSQIFITRLKEQRYPTRAELDAAAPKHPVVFATGPDASLNSLALKASSIDRNFKITDGGPGYIEKDADGQPTGILRSCTRFVKSKPSGKKTTNDDHYQRTLELFRAYTAVGLTTVADRSASLDSIERYQRMLAQNELPLRLALSQHIPTLGPIEEIQNQIRAAAKHPLRQYHPKLQLIGIKTFLDGGMLTGSAYMRQPWGVSQIYAITDPTYRGVLFIPKERLLPIVRTAVECGLQFTAHSVGDGAVHALIDAYEEVNRQLPVKPTRPCITHSNFMSREAVEKMPQLGLLVDIQPAWLYLDTRTLVKQFGYDRLRYFQPLHSIFAAGGIAGGGSDHMQKIGSLRSINPYNPFLGMWVAISRRAKWFDGQLHPEEALTRPQAIRFYTINNAYLLFRENELGSLEPGKWADFIILDRDLLTCPEDEIRHTQVLETYLDGLPVFTGSGNQIR